MNDQIPAHGKHRRLFHTGALILTSTMVFAGCSVKTPEHLATVPVGGGTTGDTTSTSPAQTGERWDAQAEQAIGEESVKAWRKAVAHHKKADGQSESEWKQQRVTDEKAAMDELNALSKRYPANSTVCFMMGQVKEEFGKHDEAIKYFHDSVTRNTMNGMALFKLAQTEREAGKTTQAIEHYRQLLKVEPDFYAGKLGLAECLIKSDPAQAHQLAQQVVDDRRTDDVSLKRAKEIVSETKGGNSGRCQLK